MKFLLSKGYPEFGRRDLPVDLVQFLPGDVLLQFPVVPTTVKAGL